MASNKTLSVRINSLQDGKAAVQHQNRIVNQFKKGGFDLLELVIAEEVKKDVMPVVAGAFRVKTNYRHIRPTEGTQLFILPPFKER